VKGRCLNRLTNGPLKKPSGGERGIRTLETALAAYTISNRAPSTTRTALQMAPQAGLEPATDRLTADSSTTELLWNNTLPGDVLLSQGDSPQLPSALKSLTSVFGMGTGVTSSPSSPDKGFI
jgi:hypothetical protein